MMRHVFCRFAVGATVCAAICAASALPAMAGDDGAGASPTVFVPFSPPSPTVFVPALSGGTAAVSGTILPADAESLSSSNTDRVVRILTTGRAFCDSLADKAYAVDCLAERMEAAARAMPATGDYADAREVLLQGAARLNALARANADPALPRATARQPGENGIRTSRPLVPVAKDRLAAVAVEAQAIVQETETLLLRSAENSAARKVHYARIAAAVDSNKVLLRSI